jgi:hypothetical protein
MNLPTDYELQGGVRRRRRPLIGWSRQLPGVQRARRRHGGQPDARRFEVNSLAMIVERFRLRRLFNPGYPQVSYDRLVRLARSGRFPAVKVGGRWRTSDAEVERLAAMLGWRGGGR